ncbi:MAG TPA: MarR family transcriptional regulator [Spirochaetales bacterium]|nr:MarR family transcriptional regulator [Spirochaetales bacterium]
MNNIEDSEMLLDTVTSIMDTLPTVWNRIRSNLRAAAIRKFGISLDQFHTLRYIRRGYDTVTSLAEVRQISAPATSQAVEVLVRKGLVTRTQQQDDRRCVRLALTPYASKILDENYDETLEWVKQKMLGMTKEELETVKRAMQILQSTFSPNAE